MEFWVQKIKDRRTALGLSQSRLAELAKVSLPTIQNLEAGKANPAMETLTAILDPLGLVYSISPKGADWDYLSACGVPLTAQSIPSINVNRSGFIRQLSFALLESESRKLEEREQLALGATLLALKTHYPDLFHQFSKSPAVGQLLKLDHNRLLKLRRLALAKLARFL